MRKPNENCQTFFCGSSTLLVNLRAAFFRGVPVLGKFIRWCAPHPCTEPHGIKRLNTSNFMATEILDRTVRSITMSSSGDE